jgi:hypothetical protein
MQNSQNNEKLPLRLTTTGYESANTTGLFFTVEIPGSETVSGDWLKYGNHEHYIVYYGTTDPANFSSQTAFLREFMEKPMHMTGSVHHSGNPGQSPLTHIAARYY